MKKTLFMAICAAMWCVGVMAQYHCTVVSSSRSTVTMRSTGYGKNVRTAAADAEINAVKTLLYVGAQGTPFSLPLIPSSKEEAESQNKGFFDDFYESSYKNFVESSVTVTAYGKDAEKRKCITLDVCVRAEALRSCLEKNGIIRKCGF